MNQVTSASGINVKRTCMVTASSIKCGDRLYHPMMANGIAVKRVTTCADGSLRIFTELDEQRMTGSIALRILN